MTQPLTTAEAAALLHLDASRIRQLIHAGRLRARPCGRTYLIERREVERFAKLDRTPGNPNWRKK